MSFAYENLRIYLGQKLSTSFPQPHLEASGPLSLFRYQYILNSWVFPPPAKSVPQPWYSKEEGSGEKHTNTGFLGLETSYLPMRGIQPWALCLQGDKNEWPVQNKQGVTEAASPWRQDQKNSISSFWALHTYGGWVGITCMDGDSKKRNNLSRTGKS